MSYWTHIHGVIKVYPLGRTLSEMRYVLETVLEHLPSVTGSEQNMHVHIVPSGEYTSSANANEFGEHSRNCYGKHKEWKETRTSYMVVIEADLRDRFYQETYVEFVRWLTRLSKRLMVEDILVRINGVDSTTTIFQERAVIFQDDQKWFDLYEGPSWFNGESNWCEYLMWEREETYGSGYPKKLIDKFLKEHRFRIESGS